MMVTAVSWVGIKTQEPTLMVEFFRDVMGFEMKVDQPSFAVFVLPSGDKVEVFGPGGPDPDYQFAESPVVAAFLVDDIDEASVKLRESGAELLGPKHTADDGYAWQHFRAPDSRVYGLAYDPTRGSLVSSGPVKRHSGSQAHLET